MIRAVVFDFDGTLVDSNAVKRAAFFEIARDHDPDGVAIREILDGPTPGDRYSVTHAMARAFLADGDASAIDVLAESLVADFRKITHRDVVACDEIPGVSETLAHLEARGLAAYVNTATPLAPTLAILEARDLARHFRGVLGAEASKRDNLRAIASAEKLDANELVFVGDGEDDRVGAEQFGCLFIGVAPNAGRFSTRPQHCLEDLTGLPELLDDFSRRCA